MADLTRTQIRRIARRNLREGREAERRFTFEVGAINSVGKLEEMLTTASPRETTIIESRLDHVRSHRQKSNANYAANMRARTPEEIARDQADIFPNGEAVCSGCGQTRPLADFGPALFKRRGIRNYCHDCWTPTS